MPLTPRFELSQTETHVYVTIFVPTVRVTNIEVLVEESDSTFYFHASPYLLQLHFAPQKFHPEDDGNVPAEYDPSSQTIRVPIRKAQVGVEWPNLDLTARLLAPKEIPRQWLHAVVVTSSDTNVTELPESESTQNDVSPSPLANRHCHGYGFGGIFQNIFTDYCRAGLAQEMLQLADPETTEPLERRRQRIQKETTDFDSDRYLQDWCLEEDYLYPLVMEFQPFWSLPIPTTLPDHNSDATIDNQLSSEFQHMKLHSSFHQKDDHFTSEERLLLATIPYPLIPMQLKSTKDVSPLWPGLLDLLVPYVYDHLTTMGDPTVESAWTITTLSSSLSWMDPPPSLADAIVTCSRRMLIYPYWRNFQFCYHVWNQTLTLLQSGLYSVVKALLQTRTILEKSESYYVGNKLFVDPYLYWIQNHPDPDIPSTVIGAIQQELQSPTLLKHGLHLGLLELEEANIASNESLDGKSESSNQDCESESDDDDSSSNGSASSNNQEAVAENETHASHHQQEPDAGTPPLPIAPSSNGPLLLDDVVGTLTTSMLEIVATPMPTTTNGRDGTPLAKKSGPLILECD